MSGSPIIQAQTRINSTETHRIPPSPYLTHRRGEITMNDVPIGFGMALARNEAAVNAYAMMTKEQKNAILAKARAARSQAQMQQLVADIAAEA